jgi:hypothetical protein
MATKKIGLANDLNRGYGIRGSSPEIFGTGIVEASMFGGEWDKPRQAPRPKKSKKRK